MRIICSLWSNLVVGSAIYYLTLTGFSTLFFQICGIAMSNVIPISLMWLFKLNLIQIKLNIIKNSVPYMLLLKLVIFQVLSIMCGNITCYLNSLKAQCSHGLIINSSISTQKDSSGLDSWILSLEWKLWNVPRKASH